MEGEELGGLGVEAGGDGVPWGVRVAFRVLGEAGGEGFEEGVAFRGGEFGLGGHGEMMWSGLGWAARGVGNGGEGWVWGGARGIGP